jgi:acetylornithine deacetylase
MATPSFIEDYYQESLELLIKLIETPSISKEEAKTALLIEDFMRSNGVSCERSDHNVWACNKRFDPSKPTILLNSHHDTVKPNAGFTRNPYEAVLEHGRLHGLGSNDAGASLVALIMTFLHFYDRALPYNLIMAATAEEEISGKQGISSILDQLKPIDFGMVGEPTDMQMAVAEKGLMVIDGYASGKAGHAAREQGVNAIYEALEDIQYVRDFQFPQWSDHLGKTTATVTIIEAGYQHNVIPDQCHFVIDVRTTDAYRNEEAFELLKKGMKSRLEARSFRLNSSHLPNHLPISKVADRLSIKKFGSSTCSDQALMDFPSFKMGPGKSERSHSADEYIHLHELKGGISGYILLLETLFEQQAAL